MFKINNMLKLKFVIANIAMLFAYIITPDNFYHVNVLAYWAVGVFMFMAIISIGTIAFEGFSAIMQIVLYAFISIGLCSFLETKKDSVEYYAQNRYEQNAKPTEEYIYGNCPLAKWDILIYYKENNYGLRQDIVKRGYGTASSCNEQIKIITNNMVNNNPEIIILSVEKRLVYIPKQWLKDNDLPLELSKNNPQD
jgi:hypothetical protein